MINEVTPRSFTILPSIGRTESSLKEPTTNFSIPYVRNNPPQPIRLHNAAGYLQWLYLCHWFTPPQKSNIKIYF
jgi:hypothetical protein